ncbi:hypothetical protein C8R43DRAFT_1140444 [Mycena crocata]|nr:hypothetical protein C8R43DRAFT_1140444 [Mycena crocata]
MAYFSPRAIPSTPHNTPTSAYGSMTVAERRALIAATLRPTFSRPQGYFLDEDFSLRAPPPPPRNYGRAYEQFVSENAGHFGMPAPPPQNYDRIRNTCRRN